MKGATSKSVNLEFIQLVMIVSDFGLKFQTQSVLRNCSLGFLKVLQSSSLDISCFFTSLILNPVLVSDHFQSHAFLLLLCYCFVFLSVCTLNHSSIKGLKG